MLLYRHELIEINDFFAFKNTSNIGYLAKVFKHVRHEQTWSDIQWPTKNAV